MMKQQARTRAAPHHLDPSRSQCAISQSTKESQRTISPIVNMSEHPKVFGSIAFAPQEQGKKADLSPPMFPRDHPMAQRAEEYLDSAVAAPKGAIAEEGANTSIHRFIFAACTSWTP
jgi:hypothetical protein